jgi:ribosomal 50S subunit-recycling heat shock protein
MSATRGMRWTVGASETGLRLDKYLAGSARLGSRARAADAVGRGKVFVNDQEAASSDAGRRLVLGDRVRVWMDRPGSAKRRPSMEIGGIKILYEDDDLQRERGAGDGRDARADGSCRQVERHEGRRRKLEADEHERDHEPDREPGRAADRNEGRAQAHPQHSDGAKRTGPPDWRSPHRDGTPRQGVAGLDVQRLARPFGQ